MQALLNAAGKKRWKSYKENLLRKMLSTFFDRDKKTVTVLIRTVTG